MHGETILVDNKYYEKAKQYKWSTISTNAGKRRHVVTSSTGKTISYKKLILGLDSKMTLYKNDNPLDLRRENILVFDSQSECTRAISKLYRKTEFDVQMSKAIQGRVSSTKKNSKYIGVRCSYKENRKWTGAIIHNRKNYYLGSFIKEEHAALAYDKKAFELYGEDATRNFPKLTLEEITRKLEEIKAEEAILLHDFPAKCRQGKFRNVPRKSMYTGVHYDKRGKKKWKAIINYQKKVYSLGYHDTEEEAARAYDKKALELYGKSARLNRPKSKLILSKRKDKLDPQKENIKVLDTRSGLKKTITILSKEAGKEFSFERSKAIQGKSGNPRYVAKTSYIGVRYDHDRVHHPWYSSIKYNNKSHYLGSFTKD